MNKIALLRYVVASICLSFAITANVYAAAYLKVEGIDGEATDDAHDAWINVLSVEVSQGRLIVTLSDGKKKWLKETGTYRFDDGRVYIVSDGKVIKRTRAPRAVDPVAPPKRAVVPDPPPSRAVGPDPPL